MKTVNAAVYARTSRDDRDDPKLSTSSQTQDGIKLAESLGFKVDKNHVYIDMNLSGNKPPSRWQDKILTKLNHRPELERLMQDIESSNIQCVVIRKRDRLFRSLEDSIKFFKFLDQHSIQLHGTGEKISHDGTASSKLELTLMMAVAEYQLDTTKENILQAKKRQKKEGLKMGACLTFGYIDGQKKGTVEVVPGLTPIIKEVYQRYIDGQSAGQIIHWLNDEHTDKIPSRERRQSAKEWYRSHVRRIIRNPYYIGMARNADNELIPSKVYPPVIEPEMWYKTQQLIKVRCNPLHGQKVADHLLSGFLTCGYCGANLTAYSRYHRTKKERTGFEFKCCKKHEKGKHPFNMREPFWDEWANLILGANPVEDVKEDPAEITELKIKLDDLQRNLVAIDDKFTSGKMNFDRMEKLRLPIESNIAKLEKQIKNTKASVKSDLVFKTWHSLNNDEKRMIINNTVETIRVYVDCVVLTKKNGTITIFPLLKVHPIGYKSQRPLHSLLPIEIKKTTTVNDTWNGQPCKRVVWN